MNGAFGVRKELCRGTFLKKEELSYTSVRSLVTGAGFEIGVKSHLSLSWALFALELSCK